MSTLTALHLVSHVNCQGTFGSETKATLAQLSSRNQIVTHNGLRSVNKVDMIHTRTNNAKAVANQARKRGCESANERPYGNIVCGQGMNLVFVGAEVGPWSKTGGLGDVLGGLPPAMAANGHRVMTVSPRYDQYRDAWDTGVVVEIKVADKIETVRFFHCNKRGVDRVFVDHPMFLEKVWGLTESKIYGPSSGEDYKDNQLRFSLLCQAALEAPRVLNLNSNEYYSGPYGEDVVFIANDWHTALFPSYLKTMYKSRGIYKTAKVAFCIHNIAYQGIFPFSDFSLLNLPDHLKSSMDFMYGDDAQPVKGRKINWMKAGILEADRVLTVSPHYAQELVSSEAESVELNNILRKTSITGIVNGMDVQEWNPSTDKHIDVKYDATTVMDAKPLLKETLQAIVGLPVDRDIPLIGFIGRLEEPKGADILAAAIPKFIGDNIQIVVLGTGREPIEKQLKELEMKYHNKARAVVKFNASLAHMITAGADFIIVPSRSEPCGLTQLHAMRYGTVPIVASTGGLVDTVIEGVTGFQMGSFNIECEAVDPADVAATATTVKRALATYGTPALNEMIQNGMAQDFSWKGPAKNWEKVLLSLEVAGSEFGIEGNEIAPLAKENVATP